VTALFRRVDISVIRSASLITTVNAIGPTHTLSTMGKTRPIGREPSECARASRKRDGRLPLHNAPSTRNRPDRPRTRYTVTFV
jgi:hypothetical protein